MQEPPSLKPSGLKPHDETNATKSGKSSGFVFGANLADRVVPQSSTTAFQTPIKTNSDSDDDKLKASSLKRKFDAITGEEYEQTVLQTPVKLFVWNLSSSSWAEKGRGLLKLNDPKTEPENTLTEKDQKKVDEEDYHDDATKDETLNKIIEFPRLIMRISGTLRIILNVAINPEHFKIIGTYEDDKSQVFRFSDSRELYAVSGSAKEMLGLRRAVEWRLQNHQTSRDNKLDLCPKESSQPTSTTESEKTSPEETSPEETPPEKTPLERTSPEKTSPEKTPPEKTSPGGTPLEKTSPEDILPAGTSPEEELLEKASPEKTSSQNASPQNASPEKPLSEETSPEQTTSEKTSPEKKLL